MPFTKTLAAGALSVALIGGGVAHGGGLAEPLLEPEVIAAETESSRGFLLPLIFLAIIAAIIVFDGGGSDVVIPDA